MTLSTRIHPCARWSCIAALIAVAAFGVLLGTNDASAQVTVRQLIGSAVTDIGPQFKDVEEAITRFKYGNINGAREFLQAAKTKNPQLAPADVMLAQLLFAAQQGQAGANALEQAVIDEPADPEAYLLLGNLALQGRRTAEAGLLLGKAETLAGAYTRNKKRQRYVQIGAHRALTTLAEQKKQWTDAEQHVRALLKLAPEDIAARGRLGVVLFQQNKVEDAYKEFQALYELNKETPRPEINMARLYEQTDKRANAKKLMGMAADRDGNTLATRLAVTGWALDAGELAMAQENVAAAVKLDSKSVQARVLSGLAARYAGDYKKAADEFLAAHILVPNNGAAINNLALVMIELPDETQRNLAMAYAQLSARVNSDLKQASGREAAMTLGWVMFRLGREADALRTIQAALQSGGVSADSAYYAAQVLHDRGQPEMARKILEPTLKAKAIFPTRKDAEKLLGTLPESTSTEKKD